MPQDMKLVDGNDNQKYRLIIDEEFGQKWIIDYCRDSCSDTIAEVYGEMCATGIRNAVVLNESFCGLNYWMVDNYAKEGYNIELIQYVKPPKSESG